MEFKLGEFFCGPGGIALGAINTQQVSDDRGIKYSVVPNWATDYDLDTCKTYGFNIHEDENSNSVFHNDVKDLDIKSLPNCDGFAFGFPCNDFSIVGQSKGLDGSFGPLYQYGIEYLNIHKPKWFVAENVSGIRSSNSGLAFEVILDSMRSSGYKITPHLYKFEQYGVPQARHRILIVGIKEEENLEYLVPSPTHLKNQITAREAIIHPPILVDADNHIHTKQSSKVTERLKHIKPGKNAWSEEIPLELRLKVNGAKLSNIYKRVDPNKPAYTVTGSGGGGTHMYHWEENRALTNRERARLQTFPDHFKFLGKKDSVRKQIGMAVPPVAASVIFEAILKTFAKISYDSIQHNID